MLPSVLLEDLALELEGLQEQCDTLQAEFDKKLEEVRTPREARVVPHGRAARSSDAAGLKVACALAERLC